MLTLVSGAVPISPISGLFDGAVITANAQEITGAVSYLDENGITQSASDYTVLDGTETTLVSGWYVLDSNISYPDRITVSGDAMLILCDGCTMKTPDGIHVSEGNSFTIFSQSSGDNMGALESASHDMYYSSIGGNSNENCGNITINGGIINTRGDDYYNTGIGGGKGGSGGTITINNGRITAAGSDAAAIGGSGGNITINGGSINATGGESSSAIGGNRGGSGGNITINGGSINAKGGSNGGAGIGGGESGSSGIITINGGNITSEGGDHTYVQGGGAGIGGGAYKGACASITINGGTIKATGCYGSAGIGSGDEGSVATITINDGNITAEGGYYAAGIGGGWDASGGNITINGGVITATGGSDARSKTGGACIGGGYQGAGGNIIINGGQIKANGAQSAPGIGGTGSGSNITLSYTYPTDSIFATSYWGTVSVAEGKTFINESGKQYTSQNAGDIAGTRSETLTPFDSYTVTVSKSANGTVTAPVKVFVGETVTLTIKPDEGYALRCVKYNDVEIKPVNGVYSFTMPKENVTVTAEFVVPIDYFDENGKTQTALTYTVLSGSETELTAGWYVLGKDVEYSSRLKISGDVHIVLCDGYTMNAENGGINVADNNSLTIYAQSEGENMGALVAAAVGKTGNTGIGSDLTPAGEVIEECGTITINGGRINATGDDSCAGIGSAVYSSGGIITINGGDINTKGGVCAASIGSGNVCETSPTITINGGKIYARTGYSGAAIGGGYTGAGGTITITGGEITAVGEDYYIGIGSGLDGEDGTISLCCKNSTDYIFATSFRGNVSVAEGYAIADSNGTLYTSETPSDTFTAMKDVTLAPVFILTVSDTERGTVQADREYIPANAQDKTVRLTIDPEENYVLKSLTVKDENGNDVTVTNDQFTMPGSNATVSAEFFPDPDHFSVNDAGTEYTIHDAIGWELFCECLEDNHIYNRFSGKTVVLGDDITVSRTAGSEGHDFCGTFDGRGHTLTFNATAAEDYCAPFGYTAGNVWIHDLTVDGTINTSYGYSAGLIGHLYGTVKVENCRSNITINSTSGFAGGFVGLCEHSVSFIDCVSSAVITSSGGNNSGFVAWSRSSAYTISFEGCLFDGKLLQMNGSGSANGGFIGWKGDAKTVTVNNCIFDPAELSDGEVSASGSSATFCRQHDNYAADITNSYYMSTFGSAQGKQAYTINAGQDVTVGISGTEKVYEVSGITGYNGNKGLEYDGKLYAGEGDLVTLTLGFTGTAEEGYGINGYDPSAGWMNGSVLTMPAQDVTMNARLGAEVSYIDENGETQTTTFYTTLYGTETTLNTGWYTVSDTKKYRVHKELSNWQSTRLTVHGDVHIILCDGCTLDLDNGLKVPEGSSLTFYAQSTGSNMGCVTGETVDDGLAIIGGNYNENAGNITINGGNFNLTSPYTATGIGGGAVGSFGNVTINGGVINAKTTCGAAIGSCVNAKSGNVTINGGKITAESYSSSTYSTGGAGIGSGSNCTGVNITINGGEIYAKGSDVIYGSNILGGAGIGSGLNSSSCNITINGGNVTAVGGDGGAAGIGSGCNSSCGTVTINGGNVSATGGDGWYISYPKEDIPDGPGIGNGYKGKSGNIILGYTDGDDSIYATSYSGNVKVADGQVLTDGENNYSGTLTSDMVSAIAEKTLKGSNASFTSLLNNSYSESMIVPIGGMIRAIGNAAGGAGDYTFGFYYRRSGARIWNTMNAGTVKARTEGIYEIKVVVTDKNGESAEAVFEVTVPGPLTNTSTAPTVNAGERAVINGSATGGTGSYTYTYYYKRSTARNWVLLGAENTEAQSEGFKTSAAGSYDVKVIVTDSNGTSDEKLMTLSVRGDGVLKNNTTVSAAEIEPGTKVYINTAAEGGTEVYSWSVRYKRVGAKNWKELTLKNGVASFKPVNEDTYEIVAELIDSDGTSVESSFTVNVGYPSY